MNLTIAILCTEQITRGWDIYGDDLVTSDHPGTGGLRCHGAHYPLAPALWSPRVIPGSGLPQWQCTHYSVAFLDHFCIQMQLGCLRFRPV